MITRQRLHHRLRIDLGPHIYNLCSDDMIEDAIRESLLLYSEFYPKRQTFRITRDMAFPHMDLKGNVINIGKFALPLKWGHSNEDIEYISIASYNIYGNDTSDALTGRSNLMLETFSKQALSMLPSNRSPFTLRFEQPNVIVLDPSANYAFHQRFIVTMNTVRRLDEVQYSMRRHFENLFISWTKKIIYNRYKHNKGSQEFAGVEIDTLIDDYSNAEDEINNIIEIFKKDYWKDVERYDDINLYNHKG